MRVRKVLGELRKQIGKAVKSHFYSVIMGAALVFLAALLWDLHEIKYKDIIETVKISVTVLISMLGFSVSIYIFLNNTFQSRRSNELEKEIIDKFQEHKRKSLGISIIFSVIAILMECTIAAFKQPTSSFLSNVNSDWRQAIYWGIIILFVIVTLINVYRLGCFTYAVINYEEGLIELAKKEIDDFQEDSCYEMMSKGEFLNLVNNIEVLVERLIRNHLHAKISTAYDTNFKRAICDGITEPGDIRTREKLAEDYKRVIDYRNLLLKDTSILDSANVVMGDQIKSVMNRIFQNYLKK